MKAIVCEMCGSQDLVKKDGFYVCQNCGTKYEPEEAKKLMVEVSGTVKVDNTQKLANLYTLAQRAFEEHNYENAADYYQQISAENPESAEANFFKVFCRQQCCTIAGIAPAAMAVANNLESTGYLIDNMGEAEILRYQGTLDYGNVLKYNMSCFILDNVNTFINDLWSATKKAYKDSNYSEYGKKDIINRANALAMLSIKAGDFDVNIRQKYNDHPDNHYPRDLYNIAFQINNELRPLGFECLSESEKTLVNERISSLGAQYKPDDEVKKSACYVATAVYGSYDCPQVWTLRRYRDYTLAETWYGRAFVKTYYAISPSLVKWFGETQWFKNMWKPTLDRMVKQLNEEGVSDTPYQDRNW